MRVLSFNDISFTFPHCAKPTVDHVTFACEPGEFCVLCGPTGSGKTTLLSCAKPELTPFGELRGERCLGARNLEDFSPIESAQQLGYVLQSPTAQLVTDTVWHELAFGLENLGIPSNEIRRRVAETAQFFGMQQWFTRKVSELSGGQKQALNVASIMAMQPEILLLDEPTSQLDPIAAKEFLTMLKRINSELGCTILIVEHRLDDVLPLADRVMFMEEGRLRFEGTPEKFAHYVSTQAPEFEIYLPTATQISGQACAFTVKDARVALAERVNSGALLSNVANDAITRPFEVPEAHASGAEGATPKELALEARAVWYRYDRKDEPIIKGLSLKLETGTIHGIVGGNGSGKTTLLHLLSQGVKPLKGRIAQRTDLRCGLLSQDPQTMFVRDSVLEDLCEALPAATDATHVAHTQLKAFGIDHLAHQHPYDLSGGEMQKVALAKLMLIDPDIILLDEPTKGLDPAAKKDCGALLQALKQQGKTIGLVSHDLDFVARYADTCSLLFNGEITSTAPAHDFFLHNTFYTTSTYRVTRNLLDGCVTLDDFFALKAQSSCEATYESAQVEHV